ncbi:Uncharacterised protein [Bacillus licheniformis]|nr:Uncharacterised protein [Bacillus licheniformis]
MKFMLFTTVKASIRKSWLKPLQKARGNMMLQTCGSIMSARRILESSKKWTLSSGDARAISVQSAPD